MIWDSGDEVGGEASGEVYLAHSPPGGSASTCSRKCSASVLPLHSFFALVAMLPPHLDPLGTCAQEIRGISLPLLLCAGAGAQECARERASQPAEAGGAPLPRQQTQYLQPGVCVAVGLGRGSCVGCSALAV